MSADGTVLTGLTTRSAQPLVLSAGYRWTPAGGMKELIPLGVELAPGAMLALGLLRRRRLAS